MPNKDFFDAPYSEDNVKLQKLIEACGKKLRNAGTKNIEIIFKVFNGSIQDLQQLYEAVEDVKTQTRVTVFLEARLKKIYFEENHIFTAQQKIYIHEESIKLNAYIDNLLLQAKRNNKINLKKIPKVIKAPIEKQSIPITNENIKNDCVGKPTNHEINENMRAHLGFRLFGKEILKGKKLDFHKVIELKGNKNILDFLVEKNNEKQENIQIEQLKNLSNYIQKAIKQASKTKIRKNLIGHDRHLIKEIFNLSSYYSKNDILKLQSQVVEIKKIQPLIAYLETVLTAKKSKEKGNVELTEKERSNIQAKADRLRHVLSNLLKEAKAGKLLDLPDVETTFLENSDNQNQKNTNKINHNQERTYKEIGTFKKPDLKGFHNPWPLEDPFLNNKKLKTFTENPNLNPDQVIIYHQPPILISSNNYIPQVFQVFNDGRYSPALLNSSLGNMFVVSNPVPSPNFISYIRQDFIGEGLPSLFNSPMILTSQNHHSNSLLESNQRNEYNASNLLQEIPSDTKQSNDLNQSFACLKETPINTYSNEMLINDNKYNIPNIETPTNFLFSTPNNASLSFFRPYTPNNDFSEREKTIKEDNIDFFKAQEIKMLEQGNKQHFGNN